jgi:hypothetical protein
MRRSILLILSCLLVPTIGACAFITGHFVPGVRAYSGSEARYTGAVAVRVINLPAGADLQAALNSAKRGDTLALEPGATFTGNFTLPEKNQQPIDGSPWITITTDSSSLPGPGSRVSPGDAPNMAKILTPNSGAAVQTAARCDYYRISGIEIGLAPDVESNDGLVLLGDGSTAQNSVGLVPQHLTIDRCYIHGASMSSCKRGVALNCSAGVVQNSYLSEFHAVGIDSQAIAGWNGPGPFHIVNNYLEGASENVLFGGADPAIPNLIPSGIKVQGNFVSKPLTWQSPILPAVTGMQASPGIAAGGALASGTTLYYNVVAGASIGGTALNSAPSAETTVLLSTGQNTITLSWQPAAGAQSYTVYRTADPITSATRNWSAYNVQSASFVDTGAPADTTGSAPPGQGTTWGIKNLFELKNAHDVTIDGNIFQNSWVDAQTGFAISLKSVNQDGTAPWSATTDVTFKNNIVRNAACGINTLGLDPDNPSGQACCITIENNLFYAIGGASLGGGGIFLQIAALDTFSVSHNTIIQDGNVVTTYSPNTTGFSFTDNISPVNEYGIKGSGDASGNSTLQTYFPSNVCDTNVLVGGAESSYPKSNYFPASLQDVGFVDLQNNNFELSSSSQFNKKGKDGTPIGANIATIMRKTAGIQGPYQPPMP